MSDLPGPDRDPCDGLLAADMLPASDPQLRQALLGRTRRLLRLRLWRRRLVLAVALAACYAAGIGTARLADVPVPAPDPTPVVKRDALLQEQPAPPSPPSPEALEWQALDNPEQRPDAYLQAGNRYLTEEDDYQSALRCYRNALDTGSDKDLAIAPEDSWLLMALKDARQKEKRYANPGE